MSNRGTPNGRYMVSMLAIFRIVEHGDAPSEVVIHDSRTLREVCNTDQIEEKVRFNDLTWAINKGYSLCKHCMSRPDPADPLDAVMV